MDSPLTPFILCRVGTGVGCLLSLQAALDTCFLFASPALACGQHVGFLCFCLQLKLISASFLDVEVSKIWKNWSPWNLVFYLLVTFYQHDEEIKNQRPVEAWEPETSGPFWVLRYPTLADSYDTWKLNTNSQRLLRKKIAGSTSWCFDQLIACEPNLANGDSVDVC